MRWSKKKSTSSSSTSLSSLTIKSNKRILSREKEKSLSNSPTRRRKLVRNATRSANISQYIIQEDALGPRKPWTSGNSSSYKWPPKWNNSLWISIICSFTKNVRTIWSSFSSSASTEYESFGLFVKALGSAYRCTQEPSRSHQLLQAKELSKCMSSLSSMATATRLVRVYIRSQLVLSRGLLVSMELVFTSVPVENCSKQRTFTVCPPPLSPMGVDLMNNESYRAIFKNIYTLMHHIQEMNPTTPSMSM